MGEDESTGIWKLSVKTSLSHVLQRPPHATKVRGLHKVRNACREGTTKRVLQQGELYTRDTLSSCAYLVAMGMACPLSMLFIISRLQFRMAGEAVISTSELAYHMSQNRCFPRRPRSTKSRTPHRCIESWPTCHGTRNDIAHKHERTIDGKTI